MNVKDYQDFGSRNILVLVQQIKASSSDKKKKKTIALQNILIPCVWSKVSLQRKPVSFRGEGSLRHILYHQPKNNCQASVIFSPWIYI